MACNDNRWTIYMYVYVSEKNENPLLLHCARIMKTWQTTIATALKQPYILKLTGGVIPRATFHVPFEDHALPA